MGWLSIIRSRAMTQAGSTLTGRSATRSAVVSLLLAGTFVRMLSRQIYVKATKLSRKSRAASDASAKISKAAAFIWSMCQYNSEVIRCCRECLVRLASQGISSVAIYGANDVAEVLYDLTFEVPVTICAVYDDFPAEGFLTFEVLPTRACSTADTKVIVAALVGVDEKLERLMAAGTTGERIITLGHRGNPRRAIAYDGNLLASAHEGASSSCESAV